MQSFRVLGKLSVSSLHKARRFSVCRMPHYFLNIRCQILSEDTENTPMRGGGQACVLSVRRILRCDPLLLSPAGRRCCVGCVSGEDHTSHCSDNSRGAEPRSRSAFRVGQAARSSSNSSGSLCMHGVPGLVSEMTRRTFVFRAVVPHSIANHNPQCFSNTQLTEGRNINRITPPPPYRCAAAVLLVLLFGCSPVWAGVCGVQLTS